MRRIKTWLLAAGLLAAPLAQAELEVGMVAPASGGAAPLGMGMQQGSRAGTAQNPVGAPPSIVGRI